MGNFEKLSVLVIVVIIVMILVVALYTWQDNGDGSTQLDNQASVVEPPVVKLEEEWPVEPPIVEPIPQLPEPVFEPEPAHGPDVFPPEPEPDPVPVPSPDVDPNDDPSVTSQWTYVIQPKDTGGLISQRELGTVRRLGEIEALNNGLNWLRIRPGQTIQMPPRGKKVAPSPAGPGGAEPAKTERAGTIKTGEFYVTQPGDTVQSIAKKAYKSVERWPELWARNLSAIPSIDTPIPANTRIFIPK